MGKVFEQIDEKLADWIAEQPMFFVATAPLSAEGHVNVSPRGLDCFRVLGPNRVAWVDLDGSGAETIAHLRENGRICLMFCSYAHRPRILRLHGKGEVHLPGSELFEHLTAELSHLPNPRAVLAVYVTRIADSCGYAVPRMELVSERETLSQWSTKKGAEKLATYRAEKNQHSIDGLAAYPIS